MTKLISKRGREGMSSRRVSKNHIDELRTCATDPIYFIAKYIMNDKGFFRPHHKKYIEAIHSSNSLLGMMPRQTGMTTCSLAFVLWEALFTQNHKAMVLGVNVGMTKHLCDMIENMISNIPAKVRPGITRINRTGIEFDNGSTINIAVMMPNCMRGRTLNRVYVDQFALAPEATQRSTYEDLAPTFLLSGKVLIGSTPNGANNTFANLWANAAHHASPFRAFKITADEMNFTELWKQKTKAVIGEHSWKKEYMCEFV